MTSEQHNTVASIIRSQLGGGRLVAMTGAKSFMPGHGSHGGLSFKFGRSKHCLIVLNAADYYDIEVCRIYRYEKKDIKTIEGVPAESLKAAFESLTGLYLTL